MTATLLLALLGYGIVAVLDIFALLRSARLANLGDDDRRIIRAHLIAALVMPFALVVVLTTVVRPDVNYILVTSLVGVWLALGSVARRLLAVIGRQGVSDT